MTTLQGLPIEIVRVIIGLLGIITKHVLRFVCKSLHQKIHSICKSKFISSGDDGDGQHF
jgi:hypothetical protein